MSKQLQKNTDVTVMKNSPKGEIQKAFTSPLVNQVGGEIIFNALNTAVLKAYLNTGFKAPEGQVHIGGGEHINVYENMVNELVIYVKMNFDKMHVNELAIALDRGSIGEYGEFMGLNKKTFIQFLRGYCKSEIRLNVLAIEAKENQPLKPQPTLNEQFNIHKYNALIGYQIYHINKQPLGARGSSICDFLTMLGLITYSDEVHAEIMIMAKFMVIEEKKQRKAGADYFIRQAINHTIEALEAGPVEGSKEYSLIRSKAKEITTAKYFDDIYLANVNLDELLEDKRKAFIKIVSEREKSE